MNMDSYADNAPRVLLIDDEAFMHDLVKESLGDTCHLDFAESGDSGLQIVSQRLPALILVDVEMPGMDGYEVCRALKAEDETSAIPVIFISGHNTIEDRIKGYEAGGDDYITKPFNMQVLQAKVVRLLDLVAQRGELKSMADFATNTAMTAMSSMSEMGTVLECIRHFYSCDDYQSLAKSAISGMSQFSLHSVVRVSTPHEVLILTDKGPASPLEEAVINHMTTMDRIVQFKSRMSITYDHFALLVNNMPNDDLDRCGRLRDHLAILAESAEVRVRGLMAIQESSLRGKAIEKTVASIAETLKLLDEAQRKSWGSARLAVSELTESVEALMLHLGLSESQERLLAETVHKGVELIIETQSAELDLQDNLSAIVADLNDIMQQ